MEALPEARAPIRSRTPQAVCGSGGLPGRLGRVARGTYAGAHCRESRYAGLGLTHRLNTLCAGLGPAGARRRPRRAAFFRLMPETHSFCAMSSKAAWSSARFRFKRARDRLQHFEIFGKKLLGHQGVSGLCYHHGGGGVRVSAPCTRLEISRALAMTSLAFLR
jgi:hypothetical protein